MQFKPFSKKYNFEKNVLIKTFPNFFYQPIYDWLWSVLRQADLVDTDGSYISGGKRYLKINFINRIQIYFRENFPQYWDEAIAFIFQDTERTANFLAFCLQNFSYIDDAKKLEYILSQGGSGYEVIETKEDAGKYDMGGFDLTYRVSEIIKNQSAQALEANELLEKAWNYCYARKPDYEKVVINCQNFLEQYIRDKYEPNNKKPQLGVLIGNLKKSIKKLSFKGDNVMTNKEILLLLIDNISIYRGIHLAGTGKIPSREESEYILHTTIYFWNLHQN